MINLADTEKAYLAGLFDGEGSIGYYKKFPYITITNTDPRIFIWLKKCIPFGKIKSRSRVGSLGTKPTWEFSIRNKYDGRLFLEIIKPYLIIKADQVNLLLTLWDAEKKAGCGKNRKVSTEISEQRIFTERELKRIKATTITASIN